MQDVADFKVLTRGAGSGELRVTLRGPGTCHRVGLERWGAPWGWGSVGEGPTGGPWGEGTGGGSPWRGGGHRGVWHWGHHGGGQGEVGACVGCMSMEVGCLGGIWGWGCPGGGRPI